MKERKDRFVLWLAILALLVFLLAVGCHTIHGVGSDLKDWSSAYVERPGE